MSGGTRLSALHAASQERFVSPTAGIGDSCLLLLSLEIICQFHFGVGNVYTEFTVLKALGICTLCTSCFAATEFRSFDLLRD